MATGRWNIVWTRLPWVIGVLATAALVVPWYWAAERATPGFLDYFLAGEHWKRFVEPGWKGDLYGAAHARPRGMIWLFWIAAALPWSAAALAWLARAIARRHSDLWTLVADPWRLYLVLWTVTPMAFFTALGQHPRDLRAARAAGVRAPRRRARRSGPRRTGNPATRAYARSSWRAACFRCCSSPASRRNGCGSSPRIRSSRSCARGSRFGPAAGSASSTPAHPRLRPISIRAERPRTSPDVTALVPILEDPAADFIALRAGDLARLPAATRYRLESLGEFGDYRLLRETSR